MGLGQDSSGQATSLTVRTESGGVLRAERSVLYLCGHWMGRADLAYCMEGEQVECQVAPRYGGGDEGTACLVWLGERPRYRGQDTSPQVTESTQAHLKLWLAGKNFDMSFFKALVEGLLPSKKSTLEKSGGEVLDPDIQMLRKLQNQLGSEAARKALMQVLQAPPAPPPPSTPPTSQRGYYSAGATTATYSCSPQPPSSTLRPQPHPAPQLPRLQGFTPAPSPHALPLPIPYDYLHSPSYPTPLYPYATPAPHPNPSLYPTAPQNPFLPTPPTPPSNPYYMPQGQQYRK